MFQLTEQMIIENRITELDSRIKELEEKDISQQKIIKQLQVNLNCLEIDNMIRNENY